MAEYNARIRQKRDTSANWTAKDPILLDGEIIIVDTASGSVRKKVGDGTKKYSQLPFDDEEMLTALAEKCDAKQCCYRYVDRSRMGEWTADTYHCWAWCNAEWCYRLVSEHYR